MPQRAARAFHGLLGEAAQLLRRVGALQRGHAVLGVNGIEKRSHKCTKERQGNPVAHQVQQNKAAAGVGYVADHLNEFVLGEMMRHADGKRDIGTGQRVSDGIACHDWDRHIRWRGTNVKADDLRANVAANLLERSCPIS